MDRPLKVMAYIVREDRLLVFTHADDATPFESGLQVPAGSVQPGELPEDAVLREAHEETGLGGLRIERFLGVAEYDARPYADAIWVRYFFQLSVDAAQLPERWTGWELGDGKGEPIRFEMFWVPLRKAHVLAAGQSALLGRLFD